MPERHAFIDRGDPGGLEIPVDHGEASLRGDGGSAAEEGHGKCPLPPITVVVVTFRCADFIAACLDSVLACHYPALRIVVVDNASTDGTADMIGRWALAKVPGRAGGGIAGLDVRTGADDLGPPRALVTLFALGENAGFAGGVNVGLTVAAADPRTDLFWILNPDTVAEPQTPFALARKAVAMGRFAVIGGRVLYLERPETVQADGGRLHRLGCTAVSVNIGAEAASAVPPAAETLDYIPGVSMLASRTFIETVGLMPEGWFLYFEEIDWQLARGDLPLGLAPEARVLHRAGGSIGSGAVHRRASALSVYFTCRNLPRFVRRWAPLKLPIAYLLAWYKLLFQWGATRENAAAAVRGLHGLAPPASVRVRLHEATWARILGPEGTGRATEPAPGGAHRVREVSGVRVKS